MVGSELLELQRKAEAERVGIRMKYPAAWPAPILEEIYFGRLEKQFVEGKRLIIDASTGTQFDVVSDKYKVVFHEDVLSNMLKACPEELGEPKIKLTFWKDGARFRATATFPDLADFEVKKGDPVKPRVTFKNSYDRSSYLRFEFGAEQLVCSNGLVAYSKEAETSSKHLGEVNIENLSDLIKNKVENFSEQLGIWQTWAELPIPEDLVIIAKKMPFSPKEQEKLLARPLTNHGGKTLTGLGTHATLWDLNSAATQMAKHEIASVQRSLDLETDIAKFMDSIPIQ
jgi:hypothetical protein